MRPVYCLRGFVKNLADFSSFPLFADFLPRVRFWRIFCLDSWLSFSDSVLVNTIVKNEPEDLTGRHRHNSDQAGLGITLNPIFKVNKQKFVQKYGVYLYKCASVALFH